MTCDLGHLISTILIDASALPTVFNPEPAIRTSISFHHTEEVFLDEIVDWYAAAEAISHSMQQTQTH